MNTLSWATVLGSFLKIYSDSIGNSYYKKDYSKSEVNAVEITQLMLYKNEEDCSYGNFLLFG